MIAPLRKIGPLHKISPLRKPLVQFALAAGCIAFAGVAGAVEQTVDFGAPTVLSQQGQRLKVIVPVRAAPGDRATAASFLVRETEVAEGFQPPAAKGFTVMRPDAADYVVFQSDAIVDSPDISILLSVAGDPRSPYRMDLKVPASSANGYRIGLGRVGADDPSGRDAPRKSAPTRLLAGPLGTPDLPPK